MDVIVPLSHGCDRQRNAHMGDFEEGRGAKRGKLHRPIDCGARRLFIFDSLGIRRTQELELGFQDARKDLPLYNVLKITMLMYLAPLPN